MNAPITATRLQAGARLSEQLAESLAGDIREGRLGAGSKLPSEAELAERFGVSRTVVREAISRLKSLGMVDARQGSGVFVKSGGSYRPLQFDPDVMSSLEAVVHMVEVRRALEGEAASLAAQRRSSSDLRRIKMALRTLEQAVARGHDGVDEDVAFHRTIAEASGNPFLLGTLGYLSQFLRGATQVTRANEARRHDFAQQVRDEHAALLQAIEDGDPARAHRAAFGHMDNAIRRIRSADPAFWTQEGAELARKLALELPRVAPAGQRRGQG